MDLKKLDLGNSKKSKLNSLLIQKKILEIKIQDDYQHLQYIKAEIKRLQKKGK